MQNGNGNGLPHDEVDDPDNDYWREQKQYWEESKDLNGPNQRARTVAHHSKGVNYVPLGAAAEDMHTDNARTTTSNGSLVSRQTWDELDLGGQGLCAISPVLFNPSYHFLKRLDLVYNHLETLPPEIGRLRNLEHLDVSFNQLTELPEEIGMLTNLKQLLLFNNHIQTLCYELGFLYKLDILGVYGNPLEQGQRDKITEGGTRKLIEYLRESMPGLFPTCLRVPVDGAIMLTFVQNLLPPAKENGTSWKRLRTTIPTKTPSKLSTTTFCAIAMQHHNNTVTSPSGF